jgi:hypothetical protein
MDCLEDNNEWARFRSSILNLKDNRVHKITSSLGVYDAYKYIRKNKWFNIGRPVTEHEFYNIVRRINNYLADSLVTGNDIILPHNMGSIEIRKYDAAFSFKNNKVKSNLPIDWDRTLKLWFEDEDSYKNKTLVRIEEKEMFKVYYNRNKADFTNQVFYDFKVNREIKQRLKKIIKEGRLDAFLLCRNGKNYQ